MYKQLLLSAGMRGKHVCYFCIITAFSTLHVVERLLFRSMETTMSDCEDDVFLTENFLHGLC